MTWKKRTDTRDGGMAHGITFIMYEREGETVRGEAAADGRKLHISGKSSLTLALNQHRYGDELIAQIYTSELPRITARRADGYSRVQIFFGPADAATADMLEELAAGIRQSIK